MGDYFYRTDDLDFGNNPEANGSQSISNTKLNYLSVAYPFTLFDRNMIISLNYQRRFDFDLDWESTRSFSDSQSTETQRIKNRQEEKIYALGITYSIKILPKLSFGFTLNFWEDLLQDNKWEVITVQNESGVIKRHDGSRESFSSETILDEEFKFNGFNFNLAFCGMLPTNSISELYLNRLLPPTLRCKRNLRADKQFPIFPRYPAIILNLDLDMPMSYGVGVAYRFSDQFLISADYTRTHWDDFLLINGDEISPITTLPKNESDIDPTNTIRVGGEYIFMKPNTLSLCAVVSFMNLPRLETARIIFSVSVSEQGSG